MVEGGGRVVRGRDECLKGEGGRRVRGQDGRFDDNTGLS